MVRESSLRYDRIEFYREDSFATYPSDPDWELFSDVMQSFQWSMPNMRGMEEGIGTPDHQDTPRGQEEHDLSVGYTLMDDGSGNLFVDGSSNPTNAFTDAVERNADNELKNTHLVVAREDRSTGGADSGGVRIYTVAKGGYIDQGRMTFDIGTAQFIPVELQYMFQKVRSYKLDQPSSSTQLDVVSSDDADTTQTLTLEDEGAATSEGVSLNGTTTVTTTASFPDVDAAALDAETKGDITVSVNGGVDLFTIKGSDSYDGVEGDLGVPALGNGSHASAINGTKENALDDSITFGGSPIAAGVSNATLLVQNNIDPQPAQGQIGRELNVGANRTLQLQGTLFDDARTHDAITQHLTGSAADIVYTLTNGSVTLGTAQLMNPDQRGVEQGDAIMTPQSTFEAQSITLA